VRQTDIESYRALYDRFKSGQAQVAVGTPLEQWPGVTRSQVKELAYFNVRTVEQLAAVSDTNMAQMGTFMALRKKAQDWLSTARGMAPVEEARAETARLREELAQMKAQLAGMTSEAQQHRGGNQNQQQRR
jgi:hypothetical protein